MNFIVQYAICAAFIYAEVILYNWRLWHLNIYKNNAFFNYAIIGFFANLLDIARSYFYPHVTTSNWLIFQFISSFYYSLILSISLAFAIYGAALVDTSKHRGQVFSFTKKIILLIPLVLCILYTWISPFFNSPKYSLFYYDLELLYPVTTSFGYLILYICTAFYAIHGILIMIRFRNAIEKADMFRYFSILHIMLVVVVFQRFYFYARFVTFSLAMSCLTLSFYIQRPDLIYDSELGSFNLQGFKMVVNHFLSVRKRFLIISIVMDDASFYELALGRKEKNNLESCIITTLKQKFKKNCSIFRLKYGSYALIIKENKYMTEEKAMEYIKSQIDMRWGFSSMELDLTFRTCSMVSHRDVHFYDEIIDLIEYFSNSKKFKSKNTTAYSMDLSRLHSKSYLERAIYEGLKNNRFEVHYQPIYSVLDGKLNGAEALIRLRDDEGNFVSPEDFIPIAEQNGTIFEIGKFVFTSVCETLSKINLDDFNIKKIDINLSVIQCIQEDMYKQLIHIRNEYKIPAQYINLEVTETATINSPEVLLKNMKKLEEDGIELSLDDYGSGHSNISYILSLPFKMIKIDKGIVWKAFENQRADIALRETINMMKALGMKIVAEGVETEEQSKRLIELGCDYLQGYFYSRPVDCQTFLNVVKKL
ncbi:MAG: EAL domain-containing protein [Treponema sp.]|nr:EAL domain-containing protein [Treponema sp.]